MKKTIALVTCAVFALGTLVGVAQNDQKVAPSKTAHAAKETPKTETSPKKDVSKKETPSTSKTDVSNKKGATKTADRK